MMPTLFIGHGAPMNATRDNDFTRALKALGSTLPRPAALLVISAHWETEGTMISSSASPQKIDDFFGHHPELSELRYVPPGAPKAAELTQQLIAGSQLTAERGIDHGAWAILTHLFPQADVPTYQMSLDKRLDLAGAESTGRKLCRLREENVLIIGSGNICHNLKQADFKNPQASPHTWNTGFDQQVAKALADNDRRGLSEPYRLSPEYALEAMPTPEHFAPLMYALGASLPNDELRTIYAGFEHGGISLRSVGWWPQAAG